MLTLKKVIKCICWIFLTVFIFLVVITVVANGGAGDRAQYYYLKGIHRIFNPKNKPYLKMIIDLNQGRDFIINNAKPMEWLYPFGWWCSGEEEMEQEQRLGLQASVPGNPFEYSTIKIILDEITFTIADTKVIRIHFKDYRNPEYRAQQPIARGINSVMIACIEGHPVLENGRFLQRRTDYEFAFAQHQKLAAMLTDLGFAKEIHEHESQKNIINKRLEKFGGIKYLEYTS